MGKDRVDKCAFANELENLRPHVIMTGGKLAKTRCRDLEKTDWHGGVSKFKPTASLSFRDTSTDIFLLLPQNTNPKFHVLVSEALSCFRFLTPTQVHTQKCFRTGADQK